MTTYIQQFSGGKCLTSGEELTQDVHMEVTYIAEWDMEPQNGIHQFNLLPVRTNAHPDYFFPIYI